MEIYWSLGTEVFSGIIVSFICLMPNSLKNQSSPYLKVASKQPVNWHPWGKDAFELARRVDKPVIVSIGYSSCHWCKQMTRDNYEDPYIASLMNRHFVCIKVDREERPDLDLFYMEASRMFNQSAGWPLHAFCLTNGSPFWCGTYFPKEDNGQGIAPWPQVLLRIAEHYQNHREEIEENGKNALANLIHANNANLSDPREWKKEILIDAGRTLCESHDDEAGGFTPAPKFPSPMKMDFLFILSESNAVRKNTDFSKRLNFCLNKTLGSMASGSLFDHVNGGFFRYCLDRDWASPHFEKILSDNALLISTYSRALRKFQNPRDREIVKKTIAWIESEMGNPKIGYATSLSAETNQMEGAHYLWTQEELEKVVGKEDAEQMLQIWEPFAKTSTDLFLPRLTDNEKVSVEKQNNILQRLHDKRTSLGPERDEKRSCAQHALLVRAYIDAGLALDEKSLILRAEKILNWMESSFRLPNGYVASLVYPDQSQSQFGFLEDYAFWAEAILLLSTISEAWGLGKLVAWAEKAEELLNLTIEQFKDPKLSGFYISSENMKNAGPARKKSWYDHSMPSGNSSLLRCFYTLGEIRGESSKWFTEYKEALSGYQKLNKQSPDGIGHALSAQTEQALGTVKIEGPIQKIKDIAFQMSKRNYRPILYTETNEFAVQISQQTKTYKPDEVNELIKQIIE